MAWIAGLWTLVGALAAAGPAPDNAEIVAAFAAQGIVINVAEVRGIRDNVLRALEEARTHGIGNSKVGFAAVEIASDLKLDTAPGSGAIRGVKGAIRALLDSERGAKVTPPSPPLEWQRYFDETTNLWNDAGFMKLVGAKGFHPVKISWEDIGRHEGSVWGDRISDVGIWVRKQEGDPQSARLALSVRRDGNFRDKVLVVPAEKIKVHLRQAGRTLEKTLSERLRELGLESSNRDRHVIVSNQFAIVPVPARDMRGAWREGVPPRAAFTFSIFPYGSTNFVITDVIEGSHDAIVGPGSHQLLFANAAGQRAPFTASRAEDRPDLLALEQQLKKQGMDVDVQRYYLIQVPLRRDVAGVQLSNMGAPPWPRAYPQAQFNAEGGITAAAPQAQAPPAPAAKEAARSAGLAKVAIGHGEPEGPYSAGRGYRGARADEPIRVTVVYFVTPVGRVTAKDMESFASAFAQWDDQAIWGGSFVTKEGF